MATKNPERMEKLISLAKRRGFIYPGSEIYGGLAGTWDYGPLGIALKKNITDLWWKTFVSKRDNVYGIDAAILMNARVWEASGHVAGFSDPLVECEKCKRRFRADHLEDKEKCPECGGKLGEPKQFNMMFKTKVGASEEASVSYLRPETAQGIFVNFKNVLDSFHPKLPFGIAQIGKAFRNEIAPRDFIFRVRELEQMEIEYFVKPDSWQEEFEKWREGVRLWVSLLGLTNVHEVEIGDGDRAHYSVRTVDFEYEYPFGQNELLGLACRTDFDLKNHTNASGVSLEYFDEETKERVTPYVIEPSFGVERAVLAVLNEAYSEDELSGEPRVFLKFPKHLAPVRVAVFPLLKNKPELVAKAREIRSFLSEEFDNTVFDDNGNIGKRYRRQDEIGTPFCVTIDFDTLGENPELKDTVTVRDRDTGEQRRVKVADLKDVLK
ncbi:MAG: glycyl tRNA synthetase [Parcubacteria group bacterium]|nr:glycyl tRNA synthetase [Parcubacteria group bacterium]